MGIVLAFLLLFLAQGQVAYAATITVNTTDDELNSDGDCSLREAIQAANTDTAVDACTAGSGADTIGVPAGTYTLSIAGASGDSNVSGDLNIIDDLTIDGAGKGTTIIDGAGLNRVFHIGPDAVGVTVEISGLTIQNGFESFGGGIQNRPGATLTLTDISVSGNTATDFGGGIFSADATLELTNSTVSGNSVLGPAAIGGGGIVNFRGTLTLTNSTVSGNFAGGFGGGGITNFGTLTLTNSTVSGNTALHLGSGGGGISNDADSTATLTNSTVSGNTAGFGGGIFNAGATLTLNNSTVSGNSTNFGGGGILNHSILTLTNSTVSGNSDLGLFGSGLGGGGILNFGTLTLKNTIVANSSPNDCSGSITSLGHNLDSDNTCNLTDLDDLPAVDPLLDPLADNGGPTQTHALLVGSPAIDAGSSDCPPPTTDQRGVPRPQGAACDIGAYELIPVEIDIRPGSDPNLIIPRSRGKIPVAILSTPEFDATTEVDKTSLTFGKTGDEESLAFCNKSAEDVNGDGLLDIVCRFETQATGLETGDTEGVLKGKTVDGVSIEGRDSVRIVN